MKIGIDARLIQETGVGRYIRNLLTNLSTIDKKNEYVLFVRDANDLSNLKLTHNNWKVVEADIRWHTIAEQLSYPKILEEENLDLVHFPYFSVPVKYSRPFVVTIHDLILHHFSTGEASTLPSLFYHGKMAGYKYIIKQAAQRAEKIIAVSEATKNEIVDHLDVLESKITVIHEGYDNGIDDKKPSFSLPDKYFLHVGNVYPHKNIAVLLQAFKKVSDLKASLVFVSHEDFFLKKLKQKISQEGLSERIVFLSSVSDEHLGFLYKHALAVIIPSFMEGFGLPAVEAMANDCLVVASDIPSLKEVCGANALYFDPKNEDVLAKHLHDVVELPKDTYQSLRSQGREYIKKYSWKDMAERTKRIYESCARI